MSDSLKQITFTPIQAHAVASANQVNKTANKYIESLNQKIIDLSKKASALRKEALALDNEIRSINEEIASSQKDAKENYSKTLKLIIDESDTPPPPWKAVVILEKGVPCGIDLQKIDTETG
jgi:septal ring factor EnvC (AmiA/AmiB activator)